MEKSIRQFLSSNHTQFLISSLFAMIAYVPMWIWMWERWFDPDSYYSHGMLVPLVSAFLIWQRKGKLHRVHIKRSWWGIVFLGLGILLYLLSSLFQVYFSSAFSLLLVSVGLVLHYYGWRVLRLVIFPILFLGFMVPLPLVLVVNFSFQLKLMAAHLATLILNSLGLPAIQEGSLVIMRHTHVVVDDLCSGLRSLIALMAFGSIFAYRLTGRFWKKVLLFVTTIPVAVITNIFRIVFLAAVTEIWGPQYVSGSLHNVTGFLAFALAFGLLYSAGRAIK